ncbi:DNA/RNA non-specific endonuclease [Streptomyces sp. NPDC059680]|uniref:DNA/RNA non-specific endonuclease n=1 Tax=Streptomyces sp. NPDC059680 TaxID=3346904 RepID=UPI0036B4EEE3
MSTHRAGRWVALVAFGVITALAAVLLTRHGSTTPTPTPQTDRRAPFAAALVDLALQPGVRYSSTTDGSGWTQSQVTATGEALGEAPYAGARVKTLTVGGTTYVKMPDPLPAGLGGSDGRTDLAGKWVAGVAESDAANDATPRAGLSPAVLANLLLKAVNSGSTTLPDSDAATVSADGVPALRARTAQGDLYISKTRPHRFLEFVPRASSRSGQRRTGTGTQQADAREPAVANRLAAFTTWASAPATGAFTTSALSGPESSALLGEIHDDTAQLSGALDSGVTARAEEKPHMSCSATGCVVGSHITGVVPSGEARKRITSGRVTVELTATVTIEGRPAGTCTATEELPLDSPGDITCSDADAGPVFAEQEADRRQEAESESRAQGGASVPYGIHYAADIDVRVLAQVDVAALQQALQQEEQLTREAPAPADLVERAAPARDDEARDCTRSRPDRAVDNGAGWMLNTLGANGRSETGQACLKNPPNNSSDETKADPFGYQQARAEVRSLGRDPKDDLARCHIIAARFGGSNTLAANLSPCGQRITNNGPLGMSAFENEVAGEIALQPSGSVRYLVEPFYASPRSSIPRGYVMIAIAYTPAGVPNDVISRSVLNVVEPAGGGLTNIGN